MAEAVISIEGMSCQHCVMRVKKAIEALQGIQTAAVEVGSAKVAYDEAKVGKKEIENAIVKAGYKIKA